AGRGEARGRLEGDRGDGGARPGAGTEHPAGWGGGQEERGEREDEDEPRHDEAQPAGEGSRDPAQAPGAVDRQLGRGRARQEVGGGDRVLELARTQPAAAR